MSLTCKHFIYRVFYYILSLSDFTPRENFFFFFGNTVSNSVSLYALITLPMIHSHPTFFLKSLLGLPKPL